MRYQITGPGWAIGQYLLPCGSIVDGSQVLRLTPDGDHTFHHNLDAALAGVPPSNANPLDEEAWRALRPGLPVPDDLKPKTENA